MAFLIQETPQASIPPMRLKHAQEKTRHNTTLALTKAPLDKFLPTQALLFHIRLLKQGCQRICFLEFM